jgi:hypothetical protein
MPETSSLPGLVTGGAFVLAAVFGAVAQRVGFCTMGAIADAVTFGDWRRMRMWMLAVAVAIAGTSALQGGGLIDLGRSLYTGTAVSWLSALVGGFMFGFGMTLASGCVSKTLIRVGGGSLKSLVVLLFMAVAAYMTLKGLFAPWRAGGLDSVQFDVAALGAKTSDLGAVLAALGLGATAKAWVGVVLAAVLAGWTLASRDFRSARAMVVGGLVLGAVIVGGWFLTAHVGYVAEDPQTLEERFVATSSGRPESFSFTGPVAATLELLLLWTDQSRTVTFGIAVVAGTLVGACAAALASGSFRWEGFASVEDVANHIGGGVLMGVGGITALGCTIGQGLTGVSTLALGSFIALAAIMGGSVAALRYQMWRLERTGG